MSACQGVKTITDITWGDRSFQLDNSNLNSSPTVRAIRANYDELLDGLYSPAVVERYHQWKAAINTKELIDTTELAKHKASGYISATKTDTPATLLFRSIREQEHQMFGSNARFDFNEPKSLLVYKNANPELIKLFKNESEYHGYMNARFSLYKEVSNKGHDLSYYYKLSNGKSKDFAKNLIKDLETTETLSIIKHMQNVRGNTIEDYKEALINSIWNDVPEVLQNGAKRKEIERLAHAMIYETQELARGWKMLEGFAHFTRNIVIPLKYTFGVTSGARLLVSNTLMGSVQLEARGKGLGSLMHSDLMDYFQNELGILASAQRVDPNVEYGEGWFDKVGSWLNNLNNNNKALRKTIQGSTRVLQGGWHNMWDLASEPWAKRTFIAEAMAEMGINGNNIDIYMQYTKNGTLLPNVEKEIRRRAHDKYTAFYTNSKSMSRTQNVFSSAKWIPVNFMQGYTMKRLSQVISGVTHAVNNVKTGKIQNLQDFKRFLQTEEGNELRNLIVTSLLATKVAVYIETNQAENSELPVNDRLIKIKQYLNGLNDYTNSIEGSLVGRVLEGTIKGAMTQYDYVDEHGQLVRKYGGMDGAAYGFVQEAMQSIGKEAALYNTVLPLLQAMRTDVGFDMAFDTAGTNMDKLLNGLGRFSLTSDNVVYGMNAYEERGDEIAEWLLVKNQTNQTMNLSEKLRSEADIAQFINGETDYIPVIEKTKKLFELGLKTIMPIKMVGFAWTNPEDISKETSFKKMQQIVENDAIANDFWNGRFNKSVLYTDADAQINNTPERSNVEGLFKSLTAFEYADTGNDGLKTIGSDYGLNKVGYDTMVERFLQENGKQTYDAIIYGSEQAGDDKNIALMQAMMEAQIPGGSRLVLAHIAKKDYYLSLKQAYGTDDLKKLNPEQEQAIQKKMIEKYGNQLISTDNYARFQFAALRAEQLYPNYMAENPELTRVVNSASLTQMIIHEQAKTGKIDSRYLGSIFSLAGKYMPDNLRLPMIQRTFFEIDSLNLPESVKSTLKTGVGLGNIDFLAKIAKDPEKGKANKAIVDSVLNLIYNTQEQVTKGPSKMAVNTGDKDPKTGKSYYSAKRPFENSFKKWDKSSGVSGGGDPDGDEDFVAKSNVQHNADAQRMLSEKIARHNISFPRTKTVSMTNLGSALTYKNPVTPLRTFYVKMLASKRMTASSQKLENIIEADTIPKTRLAKVEKNGYKAKKWKTVPLKVPKVKKFKTVNKTK